MEQECPICNIHGGQHRILTKDYSLVVKAENHEQAEEFVFAGFEDMPADATCEQIQLALNRWLTKDDEIPYPSGALLHWAILIKEAS